MAYSGPKRILLIIVAGIGDFFESIGAIKAVRGAFPEARITLLVSSKVCDYAAKCPYVNDVIGFPVAGGRGFPKFSLTSLKEILGIAERLRDVKFDVAANLYEISTAGGALRMWLLLKYIGAEKTFGRNTDGRGFFYDVKIADNRSDKLNQASYFSRLADKLTGGQGTVRTAPWTSSEEKAAVDSLLAGWKIRTDDELVLLNPGSDRPSRRWPAAFFAEVADRLSGECSAKIVIIGNRAEEALAQEIISKTAAPAYSSCGLITLGQLVALIARAKLLITTNSAAMHLAGMQNIPFVAVSGSADPWRDRPEGSEDKMAILWKGIECGPCAHFECPETERNKCMTAIKPDDVLGSAMKFMNRGKQ